jgi:hypothetical protein
MSNEATRATGQRSPRWAFMRRFRLTTAEGDTYLDRLRVVQTPWFGIYLHRLGTPDPGLDLHDHPWPFVSIILVGRRQQSWGFYPPTGFVDHREYDVDGRRELVQSESA